VRAVKEAIAKRHDARVQAKLARVIDDWAIAGEDKHRAKLGVGQRLGQLNHAQRRAANLAT
jgi:hypothetical protein